MNVGGGGFRFEVRYANDKFRFSCRVGDVGAAFKILFDHPRSVEAARFGFPDTELEGADTYVSVTPVPIARTPFGGSLRNLYSLTEAPGQRRFHIRPSAPPTVTASPSPMNRACWRCGA